MLSKRGGATSSILYALVGAHFFMKRNTLLASVIALVLVSGSYFNAPPASALTADEVRSQIQELLSKLAGLQSQMRDLQASSSTSASASSSAPFAPGICRVALARTLGKGVRGDDVKEVQEFLRAEGHLSAEATGYFGAATEAALKRFQIESGVASSASASGAGSLGPRTRDFIKRWCMNRAQIRIGGDGVACTKEYLPVCGSKPIVCITTPCNPIEQTYGNRCMMNADGATFVHDGKCGVDNSSGNARPVISGFTGPTKLTLNEQGTWKISASDPENGSLSYSISWGDEWYGPTAAGTTKSAYSIVQETTFTHSYSRAGSYKIAIVVRDEAGGEARTTSTVYVENAPVACTAEYLPVCGRPPGCANTCPPGMYCTMVCRLHDPVTYSNTCTLSAAGAEYLYAGACSSAAAR